MDWIIEIVQKWDTQTQATVFVASLSSLLLAVVLICALTLRAVRLVLRGYPPVTQKPPAPPYTPSPQDCQHDENLTGKCLKAGGCGTSYECVATVEKHGTGTK